MCALQVIILILLILLIFWMVFPQRETLISPAVGDRSYARFYKDFDQKDLMFEMLGSAAGETKPRYFRYIWRGDIKSMDINLLANGPPGDKFTGPRRAKVYAYMWYSPVGTTLTDFYNIYQIPEHDWKAHPNLTLVADVKSGQRFQSDDIPFAKRFLVEFVM